MRVLFFLITLVASAQALSSSLYQKRGGSDVCSNVKCSVSFPNPVGGNSVDFGDMSEFILLDSPFANAKCVFCLLIDQCTCLSGIPSLVKSNSVLVAAAAVFGSSKVTDYITNEVSCPSFFAPPGIFLSIELLPS